MTAGAGFTFLGYLEPGNNARELVYNFFSPKGYLEDHPNVVIRYCLFRAILRIYELSCSVRNKRHQSREKSKTWKLVWVQDHSSVLREPTKGLFIFAVEGLWVLSHKIRLAWERLLLQLSRTAYLSHREIGSGPTWPESGSAGWEDGNRVHTVSNSGSLRNTWA